MVARHDGYREAIGAEIVSHSTPPPDEHGRGSVGADRKTGEGRSDLLNRPPTLLGDDLVQPLEDLIALLPDPGESVDGWLATLYHRIPLLDPTLKRVGYGQVQHPFRGWVTVLDAGNGRRG